MINKIIDVFVCLVILIWSGFIIKFLYNMGNVVFVVNVCNFLKLLLKYFLLVKMDMVFVLYFL